MVGSQGDVPLVGRQRELAALRAAVAAAADGRPAAVLVGGEAGGGKTRLVRAFLGEPLPPGALVLRAQCIDLGDPGLPYLAVVDLARAIRAAEDPEIGSILDRHPLVGAMTAPESAGDRRVDEARRLQLFETMAALLADIGRVRGPVVVTIEDLQWLDESSADFLRFVLSRMLSERLVVVATVRTDGLKARPRIRRLLSELGRLPWVERVDLEPFDLEEVADYLALAGRAPDPGLAAEVLRRTRGNPYYVHTLATSAGEIGEAGVGMSRALADLLVGRLDGLPEAARAVVRAASVVTQPLADRVLRQIVGLPDDVMDEAVRAIVAEGLLQPHGAGYAFAHDLLRGAVYDDLMPDERMRLHGAYADALESGGAGRDAAAEVAHHAAAAQDGPRTLVWSLRAGEQALQRWAPADALVHLERALAAWQAVDDAAELTGAAPGRVAIMAARAAGLAGEPARAVDLADQAIQLCDAEGDQAGGVEARAELARLLVETDATDRAAGPAEDAVRLAEDAGIEAGTSALAHVVLARALLAARRTTEARPQAERALREARSARSPVLEVDALTTSAFLDELAGDRQAAATRLTSAMRLARVVDEPFVELRVHYALASLHYYNGDVTASLPILGTAMRRVRESGLRWSDPGVELRLLQAIALYASGDFEGSLTTADAPESPPPDVAAARLAAVACYAAVAAGRPDAQQRLLALEGSWDADPQVALVAGGCEADRRAWEGDPAGAVAVAERAQSHLDNAVGEGMYGGLWLSAIALAALADAAERCRQRRDAAGVAEAVHGGVALRQRVERIVAEGRGRPGDLGPEGHAWHLRALAEHARLTGEPTVEEWQQALDAFGYGHAYEQARCHWRLAEALVASGDRAAARAHAHLAATAAARMRAVPLQGAIAATVARERLAASAAPADAVLTDREREVLALVAEGLTNREIGQRLFISHKTASVHLSNVMTKLNATSRTEAVTVAHRRGLLDVIGHERPSS